MFIQKSLDGQVRVIRKERSGSLRRNPATHAARPGKKDIGRSNEFWGLEQRIEINDCGGNLAGQSNSFCFALREPFLLQRDGGPIIEVRQVRTMCGSDLGGQDPGRAKQEQAENKERTGSTPIVPAKQSRLMSEVHSGAAIKMV